LFSQYKLSTLNQILDKKIIFFKKKLNSILSKQPQIKGTVLKVRIMTPRKPNSARRPIVKVKFSSKIKRLVHIPGKGHNLRKHSQVLVSGVGARDLPGVNFTCIRGVYDFSPLSNKVRRRSIYGVKKSLIKKKKLRRRFRIA